MSLVGDHSKKIICVFFFVTFQTKPCFDFWYSSLTLGKLTGEAWFCRVLTLSMQLWSQLKHPHKSWWGWGESFRNLFVSIFESTVICPNPFGCVMVSRDIWTTHICMPRFDYIPFLVPTFGWFLSPVWFLSMLTFAHVCSTGKLPFEGIQVFWWPFLTVNDIHSLSWWMLAYRHTQKVADG